MWLASNVELDGSRTREVIKNEAFYTLCFGGVCLSPAAAFGQDGIGTIGTPTTISSTDMSGILMIDVQALEKRTAENAELKARIDALERLVKEQIAPAP